MMRKKRESRKKRYLWNRREHGVFVFLGLSCLTQYNLLLPIYLKILSSFLRAEEYAIVYVCHFSLSIVLLKAIEVVAISWLL